MSPSVMENGVQEEKIWLMHSRERDGDKKKKKYKKGIESRKTESCQSAPSVEASTTQAAPSQPQPPAFFHLTLSVIRFDAPNVNVLTKSL